MTAAGMTNSHPSSYLQLDIRLSLAAKGGLAALQVKALPCTCILDMFSQKFAMILTLNLNQEGSNRAFWESLIKKLGITVQLQYTDTLRTI